MSSRKPKKSQKLGSSRRYKNRNKDIEDRENDDGFQDPENEPQESEQRQSLSVSGDQSSNEASLLCSDQPFVVYTNPNTSVLEHSSQSQSQDFRDLLEQADVTSKHRKMGSTRKGKRTFKFEELYEDVLEHQDQLSEGISNEQEIPVDPSIKEDEGKEDHTSLPVCELSQSVESSVIQGKQLALDISAQNEDLQSNEEHQHLEAALQSKLMDISSSEQNIFKEPNNSSEPVSNTTVPASQIDTANTPVIGHTEDRQGAQMSRNNDVYNDKPYMAKHSVLITVDTQSSLNFNIRDQQKDTDMLEGLIAEDLREVTDVPSASLFNEHAQQTEANVATIMWENIITKANTGDAKTFEHTDADIISPLKLEEETSLDVSYETKCYREEQSEVLEDIGLTEDMHYDEGTKYRDMETEAGVEHNKMQSENFVTESETVSAKTLCEETETNSETYNFQHTNIGEFPAELETKDCSEKVIEDTSESYSDIETDLIEEKNDIIAGFTESFTMEDFTGGDNMRTGMSTCMDELHIASVTTDMQEYACTAQASMVVREYCVEHAIKGSNLTEKIPETQVKLDMQVYCPITIPDQEQSMPEECQENPSNIESADSFAGNVRFSLSESGFNLGGGQKDNFQTIKVTNQEQSIRKNQNMNTPQEKHETPQCIPTELVNTNPKCSVFDRQDEEAVMVENISAALDTTDEVLSEGDEHLAETEDLKMQSVTEVAENVVQCEEAPSKENKGRQPKSCKDPYQNLYADLNLEPSKSLESTEIVTGTINTEDPMASPEPADKTEVGCLQEANGMQVTNTPIHATHIQFSTNSSDRKMESIHRHVEEKEKGQDQEADMCGEEKDESFTERLLLGPESAVGNQKNRKREKMNDSPTENIIMDPKCTQQYMHSDISSQNFAAIHTAMKDLSPEEHDGNSTEKAKSRHSEIPTQTKKKRKFGSTRKPHERHQRLAEREEGEDLEVEWKDQEKEETEHHMITQAASSNLLNEPQNTMCEVTSEISDSPVTSEQKQPRTGDINAPPAVLLGDADQIDAMVSDEVSNAKELTDITEQNEKPGGKWDFVEPSYVAVQMNINEKPKNECFNKDNINSTCDPVELIPETRVRSDKQTKTVNIHTDVSVHKQNLTEEHLKNQTNRGSELEQGESTSTFIQTQESKSYKVDLLDDNVEYKSSENSRKTDLTQTSLKGQIHSNDRKKQFERENLQKQILDQNESNEDNNDLKRERRNSAPRESFTQEDIALSSQTTDHGSTTNKHPLTSEHPELPNDYKKSKEGVDNIHADIHLQIQAKKKKKFGSTRRAHGRHQLPTEVEVEEEEGNNLENIEEIEHQSTSQAATLNLHTEPQNTMSKVTLDIHNSPVSAEHGQVTTEPEKGTRIIDTSSGILSVEIDQTHTMVFDEVIDAEGLEKVIEERSEKLVRHEQQMPPVIAKIQDDAFIEHVSSDGIMPTDVSSDNNVISEVEKLESVEIHMQTQTKTMKYGSTQRPHGRQQTTSEVGTGEWTALENKNQLRIDHTKKDMPVVSEKYQTMSEELLKNPENRGLKPEQCDISCPVVHMQDIKLAPGDMAKQNVGASNSKGKKRIGSTRRSLRVMKGKWTIEEQTEESSLNSSEDGAQNLSTEISHQSVQKQSELLNIINDQAEEMGSTCENLDVKHKEETCQTAGLNSRLAGDNHFRSNPESSFGESNANTQEHKPQIHQQLNKPDGTVHTETELYLNSHESTLHTADHSPISEFSDSISNHLPSSQTDRTHMESSYPARRRKMGSSRKMLHALPISYDSSGSEQYKEYLNKMDVANRESIMAESTEGMRESVELKSEVKVLSQTNESNAEAIGQQRPGSGRNLTSRSTMNASIGLSAFRHGEHKSDQKKAEIQMSKGELEVSDPNYISETERTPSCPAVCEPSIRKTAHFAVTTEERQKVDFEQWDEQIPDFGQAAYNIVMVGNSNVGKTSFINRIQTGHFIPDYSATIGVDTFVHTVTFGSRAVKLYVWDTAGQERYHSITRQVFHKAQGLLLMYDVTSSQSFHAVRSWISQVQEKAAPDVILMLLGNKNDCVHREVQLQDGEDLSKAYNIHFMECSAATGENVLESLKTIAWSLVKQRVRKEEEHTTLQPKPQNKKLGCC